MKFRFDGPMCFVTEIGHEKSQANILVPRLVKDDGDFRMNLSEPEPVDGIHWVTVFIKKRKSSNDGWLIKPVDIECDSYDEVISLVDSLQLRYGELIKQNRIEKKKPWLRVRRVQNEIKQKEVVNEDS